MPGRQSGRGRNKVRHGKHRQRTKQTKPTGDVEDDDRGIDLAISEDFKTIFLGTASFNQHLEAQEEDQLRYLAGMIVLQQNGVEISQNSRVKALAVAWARKDYKLAEALLEDREAFGLVEVLKAVTLLDSGRRLRVEEKRLRMLTSPNSRVRPHKIGQVKSNIDNLKAVLPKIGSANSSVCKHVCQWVRGFAKEDLEFYALHFPKEPWKKLADICHFNPEQDFANLPWFLPYCFGNPAPADTIVGIYSNLNADNVNELLHDHPVSYSHVKALHEKLTKESKACIARNDKLDHILWYYEDLRCPAVDEILWQRLSDGEVTGLPTGKLMERLLTIKMIQEGMSPGRYDSKEKAKGPAQAAFLQLLFPQAQERLNNISLTLPSPMVVMGDRSGSMEVAIRTSTIIASLLTAVCHARLVFFDSKNMEAPFIPTNIEEVLEMAVTIKTGGCTSPAASLWPFYSSKEALQTIIMVTDEEENEAHQKMRFAEMFAKYRQEVSPSCKLVFVSFLRSQHCVGSMMEELRKINVTENVIQFKFDRIRPDLTKLDKMFGLLSSGTVDFERKTSMMINDMKKNGILGAVQRAKEKEDKRSE